MGLDSPSLAALYSELLENSEFTESIRRAEASAGRPLGGFVRPADLYVIVRATKPEKVIETGVASGLSSSYILQAMETNRTGRLYSIDLPNADSEALLGKVLTNLPEGTEPGWVVPSNLRKRWDLRMGKTFEKLPPLLEELGTIDLFLHDSEHSYENMMFEFSIAWPKIRVGGLMISDDVNLPSARGAFKEFAEASGRRPEKVYAGFGVIRK